MAIKERLLAVDWKDLGKRAAKTFVQTFLSYLTIDGVFGISDKVGFQRWLLTTGLSALAGAISAVWNLIMSVVSDEVSRKLDKIGDYGMDEDVGKSEIIYSEYSENNPINESEVD